MMTEEALTNAESRGRHGQVDGKDRLRLDAVAASWQPPRVQAGYRGYGSYGKSSDRAPRSPRMSGDAPAWAHATDNCRTIALPIEPRAGSRASSGLALS